MVFTIGFLTAAMLALLILPGLSRRAERLARRRVEARLPTSVSQIAAERDQLRAELAVEARRIEIKAESIAQEHAASLLELGRRDVQIASVEAELATRSESLAALETEHAALIVSDAGTRATLEQTSATLAETQRDLSEKEAALSDLGARHRALSQTAEERRLSIAGLETTVEGLRIRISNLERDVAEKAGVIAATGLELAERQTQVAVLEHKVAALTHERDERDHLIAQLRAEATAVEAAAGAAARSSGELEIRLAAVETRAASAEADLETARKQVHDLGEELAVAVERLRAEKAAATGSLDELRAERRALEHELEALRRERHVEMVAISAENEALRHEIERVAEEILSSSRASGQDQPASAARPERRKVRLATVEERRSRSAPGKPAEEVQALQYLGSEEGLSDDERSAVAQPISSVQG